MYAEQQNKKCTKCKEVKSLDNYDFRNRKNNTYMPSCKLCRKKEHSEYYKKNKHWINPSRYEYNKKYRLDNPEKTKFWQNDWRKKNYELSLELHRRYYRKNKKKRHANSRKYELSKIKATPKWLTKDQLNLITQMYISCPEDHHVDHIVPLRGKTVCGLHVPWNLQHLPAKENLKKGNR
jgi:hypothetical protein